MEERQECCESGFDKQMQCGMTGKQWDTIKGTIFESFFRL